MTAPPEGPLEDTEQFCYRHPGVGTGVRCVRCDRPICPACMTPASVGFQCPECLHEGAKSVREARTIYGGRIRPGESVGVVTKVLIAINVVVFLITVHSGASFFSGASGNSTIYDRFALVPVYVAHGQWYRLFTAAFLHYGILHITFNMYALYIVGPPLEAALGRLRFVVLYVLAGVGGSILSVAFGPITEQAAGASGAIFGLFAALYIIARHRKLATEGIAVTIIVNLVFTFAVPDIDWRGHVGGLIVGAIVSLIYSRAPQGPMRDRYQAAGILVLAVVMSVAGFLAANHVHNECPVLISHNDVPACQSAGAFTGT